MVIVFKCFYVKTVASVTCQLTRYRHLVQTKQWETQASALLTSPVSKTVIDDVWPQAMHTALLLPAQSNIRNNHTVHQNKYQKQKDEHFDLGQHSCCHNDEPWEELLRIICQSCDSMITGCETTHPHPLPLPTPTTISLTKAMEVNVLRSVLQQCS